MYMEDLGTITTNVASPGFGSAANSFMDFVNVNEKFPIYQIPQNLHRRKDPGAGAVTYYHSRYSEAKNDIRAGEELFVPYGDEWFLGRKSLFGPIPVTGDHDGAERLYRTFRKQFVDQGDRHQKTYNDQESRQEERTIQKSPGGSAGDYGQIEQDEPPSPNPRLVDVAYDLWDIFVSNSSWEDSPTMAALPSKDRLDDLLESTLIEWKRSQMNRSIEWLEENGVCADNLHFGESSIPQAGNGAFASRPLRKGETILPVPLIHIPNRSTLDMQLGAPGESNRPRRRQLLLNYALGHRHSTMLLSPYGPVFGLINHNQTLANVRLVWASPQRSQHKPERLEEEVAMFEGYTSSQLAMELVATKDVAEGDEIFLDYGDEWEAAWQEHVTQWKPEPGSDDYLSACEMNRHYNHTFRTEFEQMHDPYPSNLMIKFHKFFIFNDFRAQWLHENPYPVQKILSEWYEKKSVQCDVLRRQHVGTRVLYAIALRANSGWELLENVPQEALFFQDRAYSTDMFLQNAFRHDIRIPDDIFPEKWKNANHGHANQTVHGAGPAINNSERYTDHAVSTVDGQ